MPKFYTSVILLIKQSKEIYEKQFSFFGSKGGQISPLMHVPLLITLFLKEMLVISGLEFTKSIREGPNQTSSSVAVWSGYVLFVSTVFVAN